MLRFRRIVTQQQQQGILLSFMPFPGPVSGDCALQNGQVNVPTSIRDLQVQAMLSQQTHGDPKAILISRIGSVSVAIAPTAQSNFHAVPRSVRTTPLVLAYSPRNGIAPRPPLGGWKLVPGAPEPNLKGT